MTTIVLDTNIWIYLTKDAFQELWLKLKSSRDSGDIKLLVNDVILKEWNRNKEKAINSLVSAIKSEYSTAINLSHHLNESDKEKLEEALSAYTKEEDRIRIATERVQEIEEFINSCELIKVTDEQKLFIANLAIEKQAPFQNNKNNFNDALIIRNIYEYVQNAVPQLYDLIYVSNNPVDFTSKETNEVYADLLEGLPPVRLKNVTDLGHALQLAPELIEEFDDWLEYQLDMKYDYDTMMNR
jgi:predicted nucleic acid-binding protein